MRKHWSEVLSCQCGKTFRNYAAEAVHRHNFPALCRKPKPRRPVSGKRGVIVVDDIVATGQFDLQAMSPEGRASLRELVRTAGAQIAERAERDAAARAAQDARNASITLAKSARG